MDLILKNLTIFQPHTILENGCIAVSGQKIHSVGQSVESPEGGHVMDLKGYQAVPGYIDTHCHGAAGYDANDGTMEAIAGMNRFYQQHGVTSYYPSLSVDPMPKLIQALETIRLAMSHNSHGNIQVLGAHFEGPFINPAYKGAQAPESILALTDENFSIVEKFRDVIRRITLAPEMHQNMKRIKDFVKMNIVVSGGHSGATYLDAEQAVKEGMTALTHLYNAMSSTRKNGPFRIPGMLEAGLNIEELYTEIIADRIHVPDELMQVAFKCKGPEKIFICSDANRAAGLKEGEIIYTCGQEVIIEKGIAMLKDRSSLASSITPLDEMVRKLIFETGFIPADVIRMATTNTAKMMHIDDCKGSLQAGMDADINIVDKDFRVVMTIFRGAIGYVNEEMEGVSHLKKYLHYEA